MKKLLLFLLIVTLLFCGCRSKTASVSPKIITGIVTDMTAETLIIKSKYGYMAFSTDTSELRTRGVVIGNKVRLRLDGSLQPDRLWQSAAVIACNVISHKEAQPSPAAAPAPVEATAAVDAQLSRMTVDEKIAQLFLIRCPTGNASALISQLQPGGITLYAENTAGRDSASLKAELELLQSLSRVPMLIAVDEEGGTVNRLSCFPAFRSTPFPTGRSAYHSGGWDAVAALCREQIELFRSVGINVNLAPVCDVCGDESGYIYPRSFGGDAFLAAEYISRFTVEYAAAGMGCVLKHFPGYGGNVDTHSYVAVDKRSLEELEARDLLPFAAGIRSGAGAVLVAHTIVQALDSERPASVSPAAYAYLREELDFHGVIMTDDLSMQGLQSCCGDASPAVAALLAGCDLLCCSSWMTEIEAVRAAVESGQIPEERLDASVLRILTWKSQLGLIQ